MTDLEKLQYIHNTVQKVLHLCCIYEIPKDMDYSFDDEMIAKALSFVTDLIDPYLPEDDEETQCS